MGKPILLVFAAVIPLVKLCKQSVDVKTFVFRHFSTRSRWKSRSFAKILESAVLLIECLSV